MEKRDLYIDEEIENAVIGEIKESIIFYKSWADYANTLDDEMRLKMYDAILNYAIYGDMPCDPIGVAFLSSAKHKIDENKFF